MRQGRVDVVLAKILYLVIYKKNIAKGTTDPGVDCFIQTTIPEMTTNFNASCCIDKSNIVTEDFHTTFR